jgi:hypothetical protein
MLAIAKEVFMVNWAALAGDLARDARAAVHDDRRVFQRTELGTRPAARVITDRAGHRTVGLVKDLSQTGIGLVLAIQPTAGQYLIVELEWQGRAQYLLACVVFASQVDEGTFRVGAEFFDELPISTPDAAIPESWLAKLPAGS